MKKEKVPGAEIIQFPGNKSVSTPTGSETEIIQFPKEEPVSVDVEEPERTIVFTPDKDGIDIPEEYFIMVQTVVMSPAGPMPISKVLRGTKPLIGADLEEKMKKNKSNIVTPNGQQQQQNEIEKLLYILVEDYGYVAVPISGTFNFIPEIVK